MYVWECTWGAQVVCVRGVDAQKLEACGVSVSMQGSWANNNETTSAGGGGAVEVGVQSAEQRRTIQRNDVQAKHQVRHDGAVQQPQHVVAKGSGRLKPAVVKWKTRGKHVARLSTQKEGGGWGNGMQKMGRTQRQGTGVQTYASIASMRRRRVSA